MDSALNNHVPTRETCQRLAGLGVELDTEFYWKTDTGESWVLERHKSGLPDITSVPAPLLSELIILAEKLVKDNKNEKIELSTECHKNPGYMANYYSWQYNDDLTISRYEEENPAESAARLLAYLIENNHVNPDEL